MLLVDGDGNARVLTEAAFDELLAASLSIVSLVQLRAQVLEAQAVAARHAWIEADRSRLAVFRLCVERSLGRSIAATVRRGGRGTGQRGGASAPLPTGIGKQRAARLRALAAVPETRFREYLSAARDAGRVPNLNGAVRFPERRKPTRPNAALARAFAAVLQAIPRFDVHVGSAGIPANRVVQPAELGTAVLRGSVIVSECDRIGPALGWLRRLVEHGVVRDAIVAFPPAPPAEWLKHAEGWRVLCALEASRPLVAFAGACAPALRLILRPHGSVIVVEG